jgi:hypothetical protein
MKPDIAYVYDKLKQLRFEFKESDRKLFPNEYSFDYGLDRYVRIDGNDLYISKDTFKPLEEELEYADKCHKLEEDLGCPLEVFLGFATHRITEIYIEYDDFSGNYASPYCDDEDIRVAYVSGIYDNNEIDGLSEPEWKIETNILTIPLSDYKKHFWLRKDKSE